MKETLILPTELASLDKMPAKFYTIDPYGNYIFLSTDSREEAEVYALKHYFRQSVKCSKLAHYQRTRT